MIVKRHYYPIAPFEKHAISPGVIAYRWFGPKHISLIPGDGWEPIGWDTTSPVCRINDEFAKRIGLLGDTDGPRSVYKVSISIPGRIVEGSGEENGLIIFDNVWAFGGLEHEELNFTIGGDIIYKGVFLTGRLPEQGKTFVDYRTSPAYPENIIPSRINPN